VKKEKGDNNLMELPTIKKYAVFPPTENTSHTLTQKIQYSVCWQDKNRSIEVCQKRLWLMVKDCQR